MPRSTTWQGKSRASGVRAGSSSIEMTRSIEPAMISRTGWRIVVRFMFSQRAISMSLKPMRPISRGTERPADWTALSAPMATTSSPQK